MKERFVRQIMAFADEGQEKISAQKAAIVGLGGLGSHLVQALSYLGIRQFVLVDEDTVEDSNLNRLIGGTFDHAQRGAPKIEVAEALIRGIEPSARITAIDGNVCSLAAVSALKSATVLFGAVDNDGPRLLLTELCCAYSVPYIDTASDILLDEDRQAVVDFGGRVIVSRPGDYCLVCAGELNVDEAKEYFEEPQAGEVRRAHGYGLGPGYPDPSVVSINGIISNFAVTEFLMMVTGLREPKRKRVYQGMRGVILENKDEKKTGCYNCEYLVGKGDAADIESYVRRFQKVRK